MRRGEQTQNVLKGVEQKTEELNHSILPPDVKVRPFYDRSDLVRVTTDTVEGNLMRGMLLVLIVLIFFLGSVRAALITALTVPLALLFAFIFLHARGDAANLLSIGAIDFGIIIDGTIVMVENIHRELGARHGQTFDLREMILAATRDVDRPIFYSVAVIIAGYLPIYALSGPAGQLFRPMANTMAFALIGALILTLTLVPVLASFTLKGIKDKRNPVFEWVRRVYGKLLGGCLRLSGAHAHWRDPDFRRIAAADSADWRRVPAAPRRRSFGCAPPCPTPFPLRRPASSLPRSATS